MYKVSTIQTCSTLMRQGSLTPSALLEKCLQQIDAHEARVQAWVLVDRERARADAELATQEMAQGRWRGPLHGIPLGIKDIFDVADWPTAAGSKLWAQSIARQDATAVHRLRQAGAVLIGKTVTTQYASFDPPKTRNPHDLARTPGGSSSGSAAAVAVGMCLGALGSQTGGSLTRPASYCGIATLKPTWGRVSVHGVLPLAPSMDHVGPMANSVTDLGLLLNTIAGHDPYDPASSKRPVGDNAPLFSEEQPPPKIGSVGGLFVERVEPVMSLLCAHVCDTLTLAGAAFEELALPAECAEVLPRHRTVMAVEAAQFHQARLARHPDDYQPKIRSLLEEGLACPAPEYARCKAHQRALRKAMRACFREVDALLVPATTGPAPDASTTGDPAFNSPWSYTGLPTVSFPVAKTQADLPLAIQLVGPPWSEAKLLSIARWCEAKLASLKETPRW